MPDTPSVLELAKQGRFDKFVSCATGNKDLDLASVFERAATDFRSVKRTPGHQAILMWCLDHGVDLEQRVGWLKQPVACLAAMYANNDAVVRMMRGGLPQNPFIRAAVGDRGYLSQFATTTPLRSVIDANGFNLLFYCAGSGLGRHDVSMQKSLEDTCRFLLDEGVDASHVVEFELPVFPAYLCAAWGGNPEIFRLLLAHGRPTEAQLQQVVEHALEPHQRSGEPFYELARLALDYGLDVNRLVEHQGRTLLHGAANRGSIAAVRWLIAQGADPNARDLNRRTPLHACAERNTGVQVARLLVESGADAIAADGLGKTPSDYARANRRLKVIDYLNSLG